MDTATVLSGAASYLVVTTDGVYAFDDVRVSAEDLSATTYTYDAANQLTAMNVNGTTTNFTYDDWGRMVGKTQGAYAATYAYRFGDKLKAVTSSFPGETASVGYNYDGLGRRRLEQRDNTTATWFRWSGWEECGEYAGTVGSWTIGALQTGYVPGLATFAGSNPSTAAWRYHLTDHLGSVRQLSGQTKAALARYDYAPYGELMRNAGLPLTVGYTGHLWDSAIDQYYAPFRYYNPQTARWNMRDPLGFVDGPNVYAYVSGNPMNYIDIYGGSILGESIDYLADIGECLSGQRRPSPSGLSIPSWYLPKLPWKIKMPGRLRAIPVYKIPVLRNFVRVGAADPWTTFPSVMRNIIMRTPLGKNVPWIGKMLRGVSKGLIPKIFAPLTIADGLYSWARISLCI